VFGITDDPLDRGKQQLFTDGTMTATAVALISGSTSSARRRVVIEKRLNRV